VSSAPSAVNPGPITTINPPPTPPTESPLLPSQLPTTVRVGGLSPCALRDALRARGVALNDAAEALFADPRFPTLAPFDLPIVAVTVAELGFADGATFDALCARAAARGLGLAPLALGPHLRLARWDQPDSTAPPTPGRAPPGALTVASAPLDDDDTTPAGFYLRRADGLVWLRGYRSWPGHRWRPDDVLVFVREAAYGHPEPVQVTVAAPGRS
jgi:hypothetical protein